MGDSVDDERQAVLQARASTLAAFRDGKRSPYATVARHDLLPGKPLLFGSADECDVRLEGLAPREARVSVDGEEFVVEHLAQEPRSERKPPGARVSVGRYVLRLSHQNFPAVVVLDPDNPLVLQGPLPRWFDYDPSYRLQARLVGDAAPRELLILSTRGDKRRALRLGFLEAELHGARLRLLALRLLEPGADEAALSLFFRDATTGSESYPVGRYVDVKLAPGQGEHVLDFNRAYNPACAFSPFYNCPIPPRENTLPVAIRSGERDPKGDRGGRA